MLSDGEMILDRGRKKEFRTNWMDCSGYETISKVLVENQRV